MISLKKTGGVDGTRTRDPRRDRPVPEANEHAAFKRIDVPKLGVILIRFSYEEEIIFQTFWLFTLLVLHALQDACRRPAGSSCLMHGR